MKRSLVLAFGFCLPLEILGQGYFIFDNYGSGAPPPFAAIYGTETDNPYVQKWGNTPEADPPGTQSYSGIPLAGDGYSVEGWYSVTPVSDLYALNANASLVPGSQSTFRPASFFGGGFFYGRFVHLDPSVVNYTVYLQVRAWDNAGGQYATWTDAWNAALAGSGNAVGWSKVFPQSLAFGLSPPTGMVNFESFNLFIVPEPSVLALLGMAGFVLVLFRGFGETNSVRARK
jgi:hypothetical protein